MRKRNYSGLVCVLYLMAMSSVSAQSVDEGSESSSPIPDDLQDSSWLVITWENDLFAFSDDGYTNGFSVGWGRGPSNTFDEIKMPKWIRAISSWTYLNSGEDKDYAINYRIAQGMHTPTDLSDPEPILDDRPYAGTLTWKVRLRTYDALVANSLGLELGMVGPASLAEQSQKAIHKLTGSDEPMGWDNQIGNEPVFRVDAEHIRRLMVKGRGGAVEFDTNWYSNGGLGNLRSDVGTGLIFRFGTGLDQSFAYVTPVPARGANTLAGGPSDGFEWQVILAAYGRYVFNDITLDGNTFKDSQSIPLEHWQGLVTFGFATSWRKWGLIYSLQRGTDAFVGQTSESKYGALSVTYNF